MQSADSQDGEFYANYPHVARFLRAFGKHAHALVANDKDGRNADTAARVAEQVFCAWDHNQKTATETRTTTFLRDYFNCFWEVVLTCRQLNTIGELVNLSLTAPFAERKTQFTIYWSESYLNEVYIFKLRILDFLASTERKYKKDPDYAAPVQKICAGIGEVVQNALKPVINFRGAHVHSRRSRHFDPQLVRLAHLELLVVGLGVTGLAAEREKASVEAQEWLKQQIDYYSQLAWMLFEETCGVLAEGIVTDNDWLIVPVNYK